MNLPVPEVFVIGLSPRAPLPGVPWAETVPAVREIRQVYS